MDEKPRSGCPINLALEVIGDRWSLLVLRDLLLNGKSRYQEFLSSREKISTNILADRLTRLEEKGVISKRDDPENGRQYLYAPTKRGLDLLPVLVELARWSCNYDPNVDKTLPNVKQLKTNKKKFIRKIMSRFEEA